MHKLLSAPKLLGSIMNGFKNRLVKGAELQQILIEHLNKAGVEYLLSGYEHLIGSRDARDVITKNSDGVSLFIRHYPDVSVVKPGRSVLIEVKNSSGIERDCYSTYLALQDRMGLCVLLFLQNRKLCRIQDLRFKAMSSHDYIAGMNVPVADGIWKEPRKMSENDYHIYLNAYRKKHKNTSGCAFAFIDFNQTKFYPIEAIAHSIKSNKEAA